MYVVCGHFNRTMCNAMFNCYAHLNIHYRHNVHCLWSLQPTRVQFFLCISAGNTHCVVLYLFNTKPIISYNTQYTMFLVTSTNPCNSYVSLCAFVVYLPCNVHSYHRTLCTNQCNAMYNCCAHCNEHNPYNIHCLWSFWPIFHLALIQTRLRLFFHCKTSFLSDAHFPCT